MDDRVLVAALIGHDETIVKKFSKIFPYVPLHIFHRPFKNKKEFLKFFSDYDRVLLLKPGADFRQNCVLKFIDSSYVGSTTMALVDPRSHGTLTQKKKEKQLFKSFFMRDDGRPEGRFQTVEADIDGEWDVGPTIRAGTGHDGIRIYRETRFGVPGDRLNVKTGNHVFSIQLRNGRLLNDVFIKA